MDEVTSVHKCTNLSVIVIDKPIELGGTVYTSASIFVSHLCTIYHLNKRFETTNIVKLKTGLFVVSLKLKM